MFNAFISYSHAADDKFAPALQNALQKFAKPWYKKRNLEIYRDESSLSATAHLYDNITKALKESKYLILLASPDSEKSDWVNKEVAYWLEHKSIDTILIALTEGEMEWDKGTNRFINPNNNSLPPALDDEFTSEPFYVDLRQSKTEEDLSLDNPIFKKEVLKLAAKLHNKTPNDLASEEVTTHRKMMLLRNGVASILGVLFIASIVMGFLANSQRKTAETQLGSNYWEIGRIMRTQNDFNKSLMDIAEAASLCNDEKILRNILLDVDFFYPAYFLKNILQSDSINNSAVLHADGKQVLTASDDYTARIWDISTGEQIGKSMVHEGPVNKAIFSLDGKYIITASDDKTVRFWDISTLKQIGSNIIYDSAVKGLVLSPKGDLILTYDVNNNASIYNIGVPSQVNPEFLWNANQNVAIDHILFSPDGKHMIFTTFCCGSLYDAYTGKEIRSVDSSDRVFDAFFSPDGKRILMSNSGLSTLLLDSNTGENIPLEGMQFDFVNKPFSSYPEGDFNPEGDQVLILQPHEIVLFDTKSGKQIWKNTIEFENNRSNSFVYRSCQFSPDGKRILIGVQPGITKEDLKDNAFAHDNLDDPSFAYYIDAETGNRLDFEIGIVDNIRKFIFSPDGKFILAAYDDGATLYELKTGNLVGFVNLGIETKISSISTDGKFILANDGKLWRLANTTSKFYNISESTKYGLKMFSQNGLKALTISNETVIFWNVSTGLEIIKPNKDLERLYANEFSYFEHPSKGVSKEEVDYLFDSYNFELFNLDYTDGRKPRRKRVRDSKHLLDSLNQFSSANYILDKKSDSLMEIVDISSDYKYLLSYDHYKVQNWEISTGNQIGENMIHQQWIDNLYFSPDNKIIYTLSDETIRLWMVNKGDQIEIDMEFENEEIKDVEFSRAGTMLLIKYGDHRGLNKLVVLEVYTGKQVGPTIEVREGLNDASIGPGGKHLLTEWENGSVGIWEGLPNRSMELIKIIDIYSGKQIGPDFKKNRFSTSALSLDGQSVISSYDKSERIWNIASDLDIPGDLFKLQTKVVTGSQLNNETDEIKTIDPKEWNLLREEYFKKATKHYKNCQFRENNYWSHCYPEEAEKVRELQ